MPPTKELAKPKKVEEDEKEDVEEKEKRRGKIKPLDEDDITLLKSYVSMFFY
jgi:hypothetical protein